MPLDVLGRTRATLRKSTSLNIRVFLFLLFFLLTGGKKWDLPAPHGVGRGRTLSLPERVG